MGQDELVDAWCSSAELDQPGVGWIETTGLEVERPQMILEVDVEPFTTGSLRMIPGDIN